MSQWPVDFSLSTEVKIKKFSVDCPITDVPIGWVRGDPKPEQCVLGYLNRNGEISHCVSSMDMAFREITVTDEHKKIARSSRRHFWRLTVSCRSGVVLIEKLRCDYEWVMHVWDYTHDQNAKDGVNLIMPFRDGEDYLKYSQLSGTVALAGQLSDGTMKLEGTGPASDRAPQMERYSVCFNNFQADASSLIDKFRSSKWSEETVFDNIQSAQLQMW